MNNYNYYLEKTKEQDDLKYSDLRKQKYPLGETLPDDLVGEKTVAILSNHITNLLKERLLKLKIEKTIIVDYIDIVKVINSIYITNPYLTHEQGRRHACGI